MSIKGNIIVGQSGGPTAVINASLAGVLSAGLKLGAKRIYAMENGIEGLLKGKFFDLTEYIKTDADIELLKRTPSSYLGSCRFKLPEPEIGNEIYESLFSFFKENDISAMFYIGGNDSMDTANKLSKYAQMINADVKFIGVPKTIDNDLEITDHTPGFGSAAKFVATVTKELVRDALVYDLPCVTIIEIMGRDAGWLAGSSALSKGEDCEGPDMVFLPEVPFDYEYVKNKVKELQKTKKALVIALSEGIRLADGRYVCELGGESGKDAFGHTMLSAAGQTVASMLKRDLGIKTRAVELNTLQRCGAHIASLTDMEEAFSVGEAAVKAAYDGLTGKMILLKRVSDIPYRCITDTADVNNIANLAKEVKRSMINENGDNVTEEFINYVRPLIMGEVSQFMVNGLARHIKR